MVGAEGKCVLVLSDVLVTDLAIYITLSTQKLSYGMDGPEFDVSDLHNLQTGARKHPASSSMGNGSSSVGGKVAGACS
jgi:hypothetical protein